MTRRALSRFRLVAPPSWSVAAWLLLFACFEGPVLYFERQAGAPLDLPIRPGRPLLIVGSAWLGIYRVAAFHPYFRPDYLRWLKSTPWTVRKPLPVGPVELVPEDSLLVGGLIPFGLTQPRHDSIEIINIFLFSHMIAVLATFWRTGVGGFGYCAALFLGFVPQLWARPWLDLAILTGIYLFVHEGLWRALARFPWSTEGLLIDLDVPARQEQQYGPSCGWPYDRFHRDIRMAGGIGRTDALLLSMLAGWWAFALEAWIPRALRAQLFMLLPFWLLLYRAALYFGGYAPPISFAGRIATFRWIIPGYDQALLVFLLAALAFVAVFLLAGLLGLDPRRSLPALTGLWVLITLAAPPPLRRWRLTGQHRLVPAISRASQEYVQVG